ncbi:MAG: hydrogenase expression/formation protein HypE [Calditrichaceae bacterium]|nr:hydrogenase expression/formation protein HypE [Calditrichaceae bacterium]
MDYTTIQMAHGAGGKLSADLIEKVFLPCFGNETLNKMEDQATLENPNGRLAFTTDSFVVSPIFFPGGNIGELAINGTINDICMNGAVPKYLSCGFILEEGLLIADLHKIVVSMKQAADKAGVQIVTGDTKVVDHGSCDKLFINTSGIGIIPNEIDMGISKIEIGDNIILSGTIADHGMAVMTTREGLSFKTQITSDTAALNRLVHKMLNVSTEIHAMRDPTRGGVATTLNEMAKSAQKGIQIYEDKIPVRDDVRGACEILGIDPLYVANEGKLIAFVKKDIAEAVLAAMHKNEFGENATIIGEVVDEHIGKVAMKTPLGINRIVDMPIGEQLPRIC